ncbi:MAG TPA: PAS domain-containing protein [Methylotenera sp.]|nr:PAS domain-containing protein [Methylotenera sp.]
MSPTPQHEDCTEAHNSLRESADAELNDGNLDINSGWLLPLETLSLLYKMASEPDSAADALKLLHEIQTHQVELELQYRQLEANEQFITEQLSNFKAVLDISLVGFIMADADGLITVINGAANRLLAIGDEEVVGTSVHKLFQPLAQIRLRNLFEQLADKDTAADVVCIETPQNDNSEAKKLKITACISPASNAVLITIMEYLPSQMN